MQEEQTGGPDGAPGMWMAAWQSVGAGKVVGARLHRHAGPWDTELTCATANQSAASPRALV